MSINFEHLGILLASVLPTPVGYLAGLLVAFLTVMSWGQTLLSVLRNYRNRPNKDSPERR
jgi:hypothetical protein